jgi:predicted DCC family thiol-disulfide oxidoreductase YuxK
VIPIPPLPWVIASILLIAAVIVWRVVRNRRFLDAAPPIAPNGLFSAGDPDARNPRSIVVLYDDSCALCRASATFVEHQPKYVPIESLAAGSPEAMERFGMITNVGKELVVIADDGRVWWGAPEAFVMSMWALVGFRRWSYRLSHPRLAPYATAFFQRVSVHRRGIGAIFGSPYCADCSPTP